MTCRQIASSLLLLLVFALPVLGQSWPGTGDDFVLATGINGAATTAPEMKTATSGDMLSVSLTSPGGAFDDEVIFVVADPYPLGAPSPVGPTPFESVVHIAEGVALVGPSPGFQPALLPGGSHFLFQLPPGIPSMNVMIQGIALVFGPPAANNFFAATDGHVIQVL